MSNMFRRYLRRMGVWERRKKRVKKMVWRSPTPITVEWKHLKKKGPCSDAIRWLRKRLRFW